MATTSLVTDQVGQWDVKGATVSQIGYRYRGVWYADRWSWGIGDETADSATPTTTASWRSVTADRRTAGPAPRLFGSLRGDASSVH